MVNNYKFNYQQLSLLCPSALLSIHSIPTLTTVQFHVFNNVQTLYYLWPQVPIFNPFRSIELTSLNNFHFSPYESLLFPLSLHASSMQNCLRTNHSSFLLRVATHSRFNHLRLNHYGKRCQFTMPTLRVLANALFSGHKCPTTNATIIASNLNLISLPLPREAIQFSMTRNSNPNAGSNFPNPNFNPGTSLEFPLPGSVANLGTHCTSQFHAQRMFKCS
jgi:hypothetical protein